MATVIQPGQRWHCPNCHLEERLPRIVPNRYHACPKLFGMLAPLLLDGTKAHVFALEREDYVAHELVQTDANGRPIMAVVTERDNGRDTIVFAPTARGHAPEIPPEFEHHSWSASKIFSAFVTDAFNKAKGWNLGADTIEAALFDNSITPSQTVTSANSAYAAGVWASGGVSDASGWPALGRPLGSLSSTFTSNVYTFTAANTVSANSNTTLSGTFGTLVYDHTTTSPAGVTDQGICYNYFGGSQTVTAGTFTIAWNASGILALTL
jgi:hypothetical protein